MIANYSEDCDYLRKRFELPDNTNLYQMINAVTEFIREQDNLNELEKLEKEQQSTEVEQPKRKKKCQKKLSNKSK